MTDRVFIGTAKEMENGTSFWKFKKDITPLFDALMIDRLLKLKEFQFNDGDKKYQCKVEETE